MAEILLGAGIVCTALHVLCDAAQLSLHIRHPRDWLVVASVVALVGHVVLTGELAEWIGRFS